MNLMIVRTLMVVNIVALFVSIISVITNMKRNKREMEVNINQPMPNLHINGDGSMGIGTNIPKKRLDINDPGLFISTTNNISLFTSYPTNRILLKYDSQSITTNRKITVVSNLTKVTSLLNIWGQYYDNTNYFPDVNRLQTTYESKNPIQFYNPTNDYSLIVCKDSDTNIVLRITGMTNYSRPAFATSVVARLWTQDGAEWVADWKKK